MRPGGEVLTHTVEVATNFKQELMSMLPTTRDINAVILKAPAVHPSGPNGSYSIAGSMSFESLYLVNGVNVNENLRGQANNLYIEDAVQETMVATDGISAEYGRFSGGVVNVITKSGGNRFSGSFRDSLYNDDWRAKVNGNDDHPFTTDTKVDRVISQYEYVLGGPIQRDRLWFFNAGRFRTAPVGRNTVAPLNVPYTFEDKSQRYEGKLTYSPPPITASTAPIPRSIRRNRTEPSVPRPRWTCGASTRANFRRISSPSATAASSRRRSFSKAATRCVISASSAPAPRRPTSSTARCSSTAPAATCATGRRHSAASATPRSATTKKYS